MKTKNETPVVTRRQLLNLIGMAGGSAAVLNAGAALGVVPYTAGVSVPDLSNVPAGKNRRAVVLGTGISGLTAAYELQKAGFDCVILEASYRPGGRNLTVRSGDVIDEVGNRQVCEFDDEPHMYFNCGPARIPSTHRNMLHYCRELGVELEIFINENKEALYQDDNMFGGKPIKNAVYTTNARGFMAEIMAKGFSRDELNQPFNEWEAERLMSAIRSFGDLDENFRFRGSERAGIVPGTGGFIHHDGVMREVVSFHEMLKSRYIGNALNANEGETGPILFQPVGGMDNIVYGFTRQLEDRITYNAIVTAVELTNNGVAVSYENKGLKYTIEADYCFNCIPAHLMTGIQNNFPPEYLEAMQYVRRGEAYKSAFQARERFWEKDDIYGGISWTNQPIQQIWYPPHGIFKKKGVILSAYDFGGGMHFTRLSQEDRIEAAIRQGEKVHPDYRQYVEKGITVAWHRMNHMLGCAARWNRSARGMTQHEEHLFDTLQAPAGGRHYLIGDQITHHAGWQESAVLSAHWALSDMEARIKAADLSALA